MNEKYLFILRGIPASGKSTLIKENKLENCTVSSDEIRLEKYGIEIQNGKKSIIRGDGLVIFNEFYKRIEEKMQKNERLVMVDATNPRSEDFEPYLKMADKYEYKIYCINLECTLDEAIKRNSKRDEIRQVSNDVIIKIYNRLINSQIPDQIEIINKEKFLNKLKNINEKF